MRRGVYRVTPGKHSLMAISDQKPSRGRRRAAGAWRLAGSAAGCALVLAACGSSGGMANPAAGAASPAPGSGSAAAAACPHLTSLRASLTSLTHLQLSPTSIGQMGADLSNIERQMGSLKTFGGSAAAQESGQLTAALRKVTLAAQAEIGQPTQARLAAVESALTGMKGVAQPLIGQLKSACPGA
jgi:hypothetical protein